MRLGERRNGVEIGRSRAVVDKDSEAVQVLTMTVDARGGRQWIQAGVKSASGTPGEIVTTTLIASEP